MLDRRRNARSGWLLALGLLTAAAPRVAVAVMDDTTECLAGFASSAYENGGELSCTDCDPRCDADGVPSPNGSCTFNVQVCTNRATAACTGTALKPVRARGKCGASSLSFTPSDAVPCGQPASLVAKLKRKGKKPGKCKVSVKARSTSKPARVDKDVVTLTCNPRPAGEACPSSQGCVPDTSAVCEPLVRDGGPITGTYQMRAVQGPKLCQSNSTQNRFGPCTTDADCGPGTDLCSPTPFATADGVVLPFPEGINTIFTIAAEDPAPTCNHSACIVCGNEGALCAGIPGCGSTPNQPAPGCIKNTCCGTPGFTIPTFLVPLLGGLCSRLDMYRCGFGVVNSSNPQNGDNEVTKTADTTDPGADCAYGTADDPPGKPCNQNDGGAGKDLKGKVVRSVGNGSCDPPGVQYRLAVPSLSTTWDDLQSPDGTCALGSTFDPGELIITQLVLNAEFSTAGATGSFSDLSGDGCSRAGAGFTNFNRNGPFTLGPPPAVPQPYDATSCGAGVCSVGVSAGIALTGGGPLFDIGFIAVLTNGAMTRMPDQACTCGEVPGCPE